MEITHLAFENVFVVQPRVFPDSRGEFVEAFVHHKLLTATGTDFEVAQVNLSVSKKGTIRGIHFAKNPPGQAKYVQCATGSILDVIVDLRLDSETFGKYVTVELTAEKRNAVHIPSGFGHAFQALTDNATVVYLCDQPFMPANEFGINPLDETVGIDWPLSDHIISEKDLEAPAISAVATMLR